MRQTLVLAAGPGWAELAARHVGGDAIVHIGAPADYDIGAREAVFDDVVLSGDLADERWLAVAFDVAARCLDAGGPVTVVVADGDPDRSDESAAVEGALRVLPLPDDVAAAWRLVGMIVEHPVTAIRFQRAADDDGSSATTDAFLVAQMVSHAYRHPEARWPLPDGAGGGWRRPPPEADPDTELASVRRELAAYKNSKLGRLTTCYWRMRRSLDQRLRSTRGK